MFHIKKKEYLLNQNASFRKTFLSFKYVRCWQLTCFININAIFSTFFHWCVTKKNLTNFSRKSNLKDSSGAAAKTTVIQQRCIHPNGQNTIRMTTKRKSVTTTNAPKNGKNTDPCGKQNVSKVFEWVAAKKVVLRWKWWMKDNIIVLLMPYFHLFFWQFFLSSH